MRAALAAALYLLVLGGWGSPAPAAAAAAGDAFEPLPDGQGREAVRNLCSACHSLAIVRQQRLSRGRWADILEWMVEEQGMPEPEPEEYERILDYLATHLSPETHR